MILYIIIGLVILGLIGMLFDWIKEHWPIVVCVIGVILAFIFGGLGLGLSVVAIIALVLIIREAVKNSNEKGLNAYLEKNCTTMGYVPSTNYNVIAPAYVNKLYKTSYFGIVRSFVNSCEQKNIKNSDDWIEPIKKRIDKAGMADMLELSHIKVHSFNFTHSTPNVVLIAEALSQYCASSANPKGEYQLVKLQKETVAADLKKHKIEYSEAYLNAYKLADDTKMLESANFESEELSLDDL